LIYEKSTETSDEIEELIKSVKQSDITDEGGDDEPDHDRKDDDKDR